ncbi:hypothetical protein Pelo_1326 [Pelomyxa schiedti]|nr:hypothetical protein Pelo_1326 [Pelomyxa schiedti]
MNGSSDGPAASTVVTSHNSTVTSTTTSMRFAKQSSGRKPVVDEVVGSEKGDEHGRTRNDANSNTHNSFKNKPPETQGVVLFDGAATLSVDTFSEIYDSQKQTTAQTKTHDKDHQKRESSLGTIVEEGSDSKSQEISPADVPVDANVSTPHLGDQLEPPNAAVIKEDKLPTPGLDSLTTGPTLTADSSTQQVVEDLLIKSEKRDEAMLVAVTTSDGIDATESENKPEVHSSDPGDSQLAPFEDIDDDGLCILGEDMIPVATKFHHDDNTVVIFDSPHHNAIKLTEAPNLTEELKDATTDDQVKVDVSSSYDAKDFDSVDHSEQDVKISHTKPVGKPQNQIKPASKMASPVRGKVAVKQNTKKSSPVSSSPQPGSQVSLSIAGKSKSTKVSNVKVSTTTTTVTDKSATVRRNSSPARSKNIPQPTSNTASCPVQNTTKPALPKFSVTTPAPKTKDKNVNTPEPIKVSKKQPLPPKLDTTVNNTQKSRPDPKTGATNTTKDKKPLPSMKVSTFKQSEPVAVTQKKPPSNTELPSPPCTDTNAQPCIKASAKPSNTKPPHPPQTRTTPSTVPKTANVKTTTVVDNPPIPSNSSSTGDAYTKWLQDKISAQKERDRLIQAWQEERKERARERLLEAQAQREVEKKLEEEWEVRLVAVKPPTHFTRNKAKLLRVSGTPRGPTFSTKNSLASTTTLRATSAYASSTSTTTLRATATTGGLKR